MRRQQIALARLRAPQEHLLEHFSFLLLDFGQLLFQFRALVRREAAQFAAELRFERFALDFFGAFAAHRAPPSPSRMACGFFVSLSRALSFILSSVIDTSRPFRAVPDMGRRVFFSRWGRRLESKTAPEGRVTSGRQNAGATSTVLPLKHGQCRFF